jgi:hypothetical protein
VHAVLDCDHQQRLGLSRGSSLVSSKIRENAENLTKSTGKKVHMQILTTSLKKLQLCLLYMEQERNKGGGEMVSRLESQELEAVAVVFSVARWGSRPVQIIGDER